MSPATSEFEAMMSRICGTSSPTSKPKRKGPTPEACFQKAAVAYLKACRIGEVVRVNVGQAWMGGSPNGAYRGRLVKFGEKGHTDLVVRPENSLRQVFVECKAPGWKPQQPPRPGAAVSTLKKYRNHLDQVEFQEARRKQGHVAFFASSLQEIHAQLLAAGFTGLPDPSTYRQGKR